MEHIKATAVLNEEGYYLGTYYPVSVSSSSAKKNTKIFMFRAFDRTGRTDLFDTETEAENWLKKNWNESA